MDKIQPWDSNLKKKIKFTTEPTKQPMKREGLLITKKKTKMKNEKNVKKFLDAETHFFDYWQLFSNILISYTSLPPSLYLPCNT